MPGAPLLTRVPKHYLKTITFDGAAGSGAVGSVNVATVTGRILLLEASLHCTTALAGGGSISFGVTGNTAALIASTTGTDIDAGEFWADTTPEAAVSDAIVNKNISADMLFTIITDTITAGVIEVSLFWLPYSNGAKVGEPTS